MSESAKKEIESNIRAVLISTKGKVSLRDLNRDYQMLVGSKIPHRDFKCSSLEEFLSTIPSLVTIQTHDGLMVDARPSAETAHIAQMVGAQKENKKKPKASAKRPQSYPRPRVLPTNQQWTPLATSTRRKQNPATFAAANSGRHLRSHTSPTSTANTRLSTVVRHAQFVDLPNTKTSTAPPSKRSSPPSATSNGSPPNHHQYNQQQQHHQQRTKPPHKTPLLPTPPASHQLPLEQLNTNGTAAAAANTRIQKISQLMSRQQLKDAAMATSNGQSTPTTPTTPRVLSPHSVRQESLQHLDLTNPVWNWSSDESSPLAVRMAGQDRHLFNPDNPAAGTAGNKLQELTNFVSVHKLDQPDIKVLSRKSKPRQPTLYDCKIKIGKFSYSSYPKDCKTEQEAKVEAARIALEDLAPRYVRQKSLHVSTEDDVLARIPAMVQKHYSGLFNSQLELDYTDRYEEMLPQNWLVIVDMLECISVEPCLENKYILRYCKPGEILQKGNSCSLSTLASNVSVPSNTIQANEEYFLAEITCPMSIGEIWCRQLDTPEADSFDRMVSSFEEYYERSGEVATAINVGGYYVAKTEDGWFRVRVTELGSGAELDVVCFLVDTGDEERVNRTNVYYLKRQFAVEQQQAFVVRLQALDDLLEFSKSSDEMRKLESKQVMIKAVAKTSSEEDVSNPDPILTVVMFDPATNTYVNETLLANLSIEAAKPKLNQNDIINEVYVMHVDDNGDLYVRIKHAGSSYMDDLLECVEASITTNSHDCKPEKQFTKDGGALYYVQNAADKSWYRARVLDMSPCKSFVQFYYVDVGSTEIKNAKTETVYRLDRLSSVLNRFPNQAIHVRMAFGDGNKVPSNFVSQVAAYMKDTEMVLMKVLEKRYDADAKTHVPYVEFFKRSEPDMCLFSVNQSLSLESEISPLIGDGNNNNSSTKNVSMKIKRLQSLNETKEKAPLSPNGPIPSCGLLHAPPFPKVGDYFDVKIPCAVNPWNFFVQPLDSSQKLVKLMNTLQERYKHIRYSPLDIDNIQPGKIYVSKHDDGLWYRTCVMKVIHSGSISVFYCDFGYYANLTLQQLIPLDPDLMELPYQAIKAKLDGIKPKNAKWTMEDCEFFQKYVQHKSYVSIVAEISTDEMYRCDPVLHLKLVDTSTKEDIYVDKVLIKEGIAVGLS